MGSYIFKWPHAASEVFVTGTFDDWGKTVRLQRKGDIYEKDVELPNADEKILYKFVVDGTWTTDHEAPKEDDGHNNVNNVLTPEDIKKTSSSHTAEEATAGTAGGVAAAGGTAALMSGVTPESSTAKMAADIPKGSEEAPTTMSSAAPESTTSDLAKDVALEKSSSPPGAFPETPAIEPQEFSVNPIPKSEGNANPFKAEAGTGVPPANEVTNHTVESTATTDKAGYEADASSAMPAEEAKEFSVKPLPATPGISNPINPEAGTGVPPSSEFTNNTVESTATTDKAGYERDASAALPAALGGAALGAGGGFRSGSAFTMPGKSENMIPESSLPMGGEAKDTTDTGPHVQSAAPESTTAALAGQVPKEPRGEATVIDDEKPSATVSGPAADVPEVVQESMAQAKSDPEAAASSEMVEEKKEMETELLKEVKTTNAAGEPAPTATAGITETAPTATTDATESAPTETAAAAETAPAAVVGEPKAEEPKVEGTKKAELAPFTASSRKNEERDLSPMTRDPHSTTDAAATTTPNKDTTTALPTASNDTTTKSQTSTNNTAADKKKKRLSFFGKLKEKLKN